ncbi:MAG TPA: MFS transporter [Candidatus Lumbricidophila sp.]|nr:MFS transporter [Candidatus Lumbricidophila sp.]
MDRARTDSTERLPVLKLLVLAGANFVAVSSEFLPTAIVPSVATSLDVTEAQVGLLITVFAAMVVIFTTPLVALTRNLPRKPLLLAALCVFAISNIICAIAPNYPVLVAARVLSGMVHGLFWAVSTPYIARMVHRDHLAKAISIAATGGTLAFVLGVPVGAAIDQAVGWRWSFVVMAALVFAFAALAWRFLPAVQHHITLATGEIPLPVRRERAIRMLYVFLGAVLVLITTHNVYGTYQVPWMLQVGHVDPAMVSLLLALNGGAGFVTLAIVAAWGDRHPRALVRIALVVIALAMVGLALFGRGGWGVLVFTLFWATAVPMVPQVLQVRMMRAASMRLRDVSGALVPVAFNIAIGGGALIGGLLFDGVGVAVLPWVLAGGAIATLVVLISTERWAFGDLGLRRQR